MADRFVLLDTGPLAALFNSADQDHAAARAWFKACDRLLVTTEAVITETAYLLSDSAAMQAGALQWIKSARDHRRLEIAPVDDHATLASMIERYGDLSCDYADATLIAVGNARDIRDIATLDERDFAVYRLKGNRSFQLVFGCDRI